MHLKALPTHERKKMTRKNAISLLLSAGLMSGCATVSETPTNIVNAAANTTSNVATSAANTVSSTVTEVVTEDPQALLYKQVAIQALNEMSQYLRSLKSFHVRADVSHTEALADGQRILLSKSVEIKAEMPAKLWARTATKYEQKEFFYDGEIFSLYTPKLGYYASFNTLGTTLGQVVLNAKKNYDIDVPIVDLFLWGTAADSSAEVDKAIIVGIAEVNGIACNQFSFSQQGVDWQICIQRDGTPLPLRFAIFEKGEDLGLGQMAVFNWDTSPNLIGQNYTFVPKASDEKITFRKVVAESK